MLKVKKNYQTDHFRSHDCYWCRHFYEEILQTKCLSDKKNFKVIKYWRQMQ